jgi:sterol desaturase/sphingolipid hydroxylase (fatty acid hydroxylase superfamily)
MLDFSQPATFALTTAFFFAVILGRYVLVSVLAHRFFYSWRAGRWRGRKIGKRAYPVAQFRREVLWSTLTTAIFALAGAATLVLWQEGYTKVYTEASEYPLWWMPISLALAMFLHEGAYYWMHRWMHRPGVYRLVHKVHHDSGIPSAFTAFSFHPIEGVLQALIFPIILVLVPMHPVVLVIYLTLMTVSALINHLDIEVYPKGFYRHPVGRWIIGATHHSMHHKQHRYHFGLFFTFWDHWAGTEHPKFNQRFEELTGSAHATNEELEHPVS